jgi:predicted transposase/invertase (TIGR01784 family)
MSITKFLDPKNDVAFRRIFGSEKNKDILIHFINDILELKDRDKIKEITFLPTIAVPEIAAKKQSVVDVLCKDENGVQLIIEMQVAPQEGFEKRAQYYAAKAYSRQLNKGKKEGARYIDLKAVIFIAISDNIIFKDKIFYKSDHIMLDKESYSHDLKDFSFTFIELPKFKITDINLLTNIVEKWCFFFKNADKTSEADLRKLIGSDNVIERAYEELNQFNWTEDELLTYEQETKRIMDNQAAEDYKINQIKQQIIEAEEKGKAEGKVEGKVEENIRVKIEIAKNLLSQNIDINTISTATGLSIAEIEKLKD